MCTASERHRNPACAHKHAGIPVGTHSAPQTHGGTRVHTYSTSTHTHTKDVSMPEGNASNVRFRPGAVASSAVCVPLSHTTVTWFSPCIHPTTNGHHDQPPTTNGHHDQPAHKRIFTPITGQYRP